MVWTVGTMTDVSLAVFRERFLTVAKAPCLNNYIFANIYGAAHLIAVSSGFISNAARTTTASRSPNILS